LERVRTIVTSDGARLALTELYHGAPRQGGPRFLLLHGFAQNRLAFTLGPLPRLLLERGARVFVGELRGHGRSRAHRQIPRHSLETHLTIDVPRLIEELGPPVHLIGHSMGGYLGYAMLSQPGALASLATFGAPVLLGSGRRLVRMASILAAPIGSAAPGAIPMDHFLRLLSSFVAAPDARGLTRAVQLLTRLASPEAAAPHAIETILANADPASPSIFVELAKMALAREPRIAGVDLVKSLLAAPIPVAAIIGSDDAFGDRLGLRPFDLPEQAGPRLVIEVPGGSHVDLTIGHHLPATIERLWPFLLEGR
jgi:pimeloyl-ACP methyl ester carboxylesterase